MPKSYWSPKEIAELKTMVNAGIDDHTISIKIGKTKNAVQIKRNRIIGSFIFCLDCGIKVQNVRGKRLRCKGCADAKTESEKKQRAANWYALNKELRRLTRDNIRFGGNRELAIKRDNEQCVNCGMTRSDHYLKYGCDITVDHKDGQGRNSEKQNNDIENLITLCLSCHGKKDVKRRRKDWSMCAEFLKKYWQEQSKNEKKSIGELLLEGKTPGRYNNKKLWK